jgi:hypothetical protein
MPSAGDVAVLERMVPKAPVTDVPTHCEVEALVWRSKGDKAVAAGMIVLGLDPRDSGQRRIWIAAAFSKPNPGVYREQWTRMIDGYEVSSAQEERCRPTEPTTARGLPAWTWLTRCLLRNSGEISITRFTVQPV